MERLFREYLRPGDRIAVEDPSLPAVLDLIGGSGFQPVPVAMDQEGPRPDSLMEAIARGARGVVLTPRAQNPTGAAFSKSRAAELTRVLKGHRDVLVIENDPAGPIAGVPYATACHGLKRWAVIRSVSKFLGPDLRVAVIAGDRADDRSGARSAVAGSPVGKSICFRTWRSRSGRTPRTGVVWLRRPTCTRRDDGRSWTH
jgi:DNA-binding transcriptional MocR family regulator